jgi:hypothetical protein
VPPHSFIQYCVEPYICASVSSHRWWCFHNQLNCDRRLLCQTFITANQNWQKHMKHKIHSQVQFMQVTINFLLQLLKACLLRRKSHTFTTLTHTGFCVCVVT